MPAKPSYCAKLPIGIEVLRAMEIDWIDRRQLEEVLGVSKTVAWRLLRLCGVAPGPGGALVVQREDLVARLERLAQDGGPIEREIQRHGRLEDFLERVRPAVIANLKRVARDPKHALELINSRFAKLPANVVLTPSSLHIDFFGTEDFLQTVGAIVYALNNDYEAISSFIEEGCAAKPVRPRLPA
jgi:hypothetical protein